jgi:hypothetical protein
MLCIDPSNCRSVGPPQKAIVEEKLRKSIKEAALKGPT